MLVLTFLLCGSIGFAQDSTLTLWPGGVPGAIDDPEYVEGLFKERAHRIARVSDPTIAVYLPSQDIETGTAVVICPGGGYSYLSIGPEGFDVARWLASYGVAAIVLKYRLPSDRIMKEKSIGPLQDAQRAVRLVRKHAKQWRIDKDKIGIMGFSAGGHLAATLSTQFDREVYPNPIELSARPDFSILIYPVISMTNSLTHGGSRTNLIGEEPGEVLITQYSNEQQISQETSPAFLVHAADDGAVPVGNSIAYFNGLNALDIPAEMHIYESGGHGFALGDYDHSAGAWPETLQEWLKGRGLLGDQ
ncbi:MAG: alpha/beta hydrolase [Candidatus Marinimicrobia bacterium]|nr:alpha/beta hydrolase [Candidatus Neomarinimicrobiota bacterium]MCF7828318.1 alpha/beta hydrolase [Candidatus Neomarinimicrobiota bacterium]MCF7879507.1 alpha/beta hydrolase [Candidatus Neomarinimicrobiota bacterium]